LKRINGRELGSKTVKIEDLLLNNWSIIYFIKLGSEMIKKEAQLLRDRSGIVGKQKEAQQLNDRWGIDGQEFESEMI
jgi:hypothetical protein